MTNTKLILSADLPSPIAHALSIWYAKTTDEMVKIELQKFATRSNLSNTRILEISRGFIALDWFMRIHAPLWHSMADKTELFKQLKNSSQIISKKCVAREMENHLACYRISETDWEQERISLDATIKSMPKGLANSVLNESGKAAVESAHEAGWHSLRLVAEASCIGSRIPWETTRMSIISSIRPKVWGVGLTAAVGIDVEQDAVNAARLAIKKMLLPLVEISKKSALTALTSIIEIK